MTTRLPSWPCTIAAAIREVGSAARKLWVACLLPLLGVICILSANSSLVAQSIQDPRRVLVSVNGQPIKEGDLQFLLLSRNVPEALREQSRQPLLDQLVDRELIRQFLTKRETRVDEPQLTELVKRWREAVRGKGQDPDQVLSRIGYTEERLRSELALPLAWQANLRLVLTPERVREFFQRHRAEFDGTRVRASQIFLKLPENASDLERNERKQKLQAIREEITSGKPSFAEAARKYSEAPTRENGGDVGFFPFRGQMPRWFSEIAFKLMPGEISEPVVSPFGVHLIQVTERKPGDQSLEDVRPQVLEALSAQLWDEQVRREREMAKIEWRVEAK